MVVSKEHESAAGGVAGTWDAGLAAEIIASHAGQEGAALPILHAIQAAFGHIPRPCEAMIASALNLSKAEMRGVVSFYHDFRSHPAGRHVLKLCRAEACQSMGCAALAETLLRRLALEWGGTTLDGALTVEGVYCLGLCACAPAALLDDEPIGRLSEAGLAELAQQLTQVTCPESVA